MKDIKDFMKVVDNTTDGIHIVEGDIVYYYDERDWDKHYAFAQSDKLVPMTLASSFSEVVSETREVTPNDFHLTTFSLWKRLINAGLLTAKSLIENSPMLLKILSTNVLSRALKMFETQYGCTLVIAGDSTTEIEFFNSSSHDRPTVFTAPAFEFVANLLEAIDAATLPKDLDFFLVNQYNKYREG